MTSGEIYNYLITSVTDAGETTASMPLTFISGASISNLSTNSNVLNWDAVSGITTYNVYGRATNSETLLGTVVGTSFTDSGIAVGTQKSPLKNTAVESYLFDLPKNYAYMSIPVLSGLDTNQVLDENNDYNILGLKNIRFNKQLSGVVSSGKITLDSSTLPQDSGHTFSDLSGHSHGFTIDSEGNGITTDTSSPDLHTHSISSYEVVNGSNNGGTHSHRIYTKELSVLNKQSITLIPSLLSIYFPAFGEEDYPEIIVESEYYTPNLSGYSTETDYFTKRKMYASHLVKWAHATSSKLRSAPTIKNLTDAIGLINAVPFTYEAGEVMSIDEYSSYNYVDILASGADNSTCYQIPNSLYLKYRVGDTVEKHELLCSGIWASDYLTDPTTISGIMDREGSIENFDIFPRIRKGKNPYFHVVTSLGKEPNLPVEHQTKLTDAIINNG